jgi:hypothetical protein
MQFSIQFHIYPRYASGLIYRLPTKSAGASPGRYLQTYSRHLCTRNYLTSFFGYCSTSDNIHGSQSRLHCEPGEARYDPVHQFGPRVKLSWGRRLAHHHHSSDCTSHVARCTPQGAQCGPFVWCCALSCRSLLPTGFPRVPPSGDKDQFD